MWDFDFDRDHFHSLPSNYSYTISSTVGTRSTIITSYLDANQVFYVGCCLALSTKFLIAPLVRNVSTEEWSNLCVFPFVNSENSVPKPCCDASVSSFKVHLNTQIFLVLKICFFIIILPQKSWLNPVLSMPCCSRASLLRPVYTCDFCRSNLMLKTILQRFGCNSPNGNNFEQRFRYGTGAYSLFSMQLKAALFSIFKVSISLVTITKKRKFKNK